MLDQTPRIHLMIEKLYDQYQRGCIEDEWTEKFILDMHAWMKQNATFSPKQIAKIEELFERN